MKPLMIAHEGLFLVYSLKPRASNCPYLRLTGLKS